jgi:hypothetical protein
VQVLEVSSRILVDVVMVNIKEGIVLQPARLIHVKEKTDTWHFPTFSMCHEPVDIDNLFRSLLPMNASYLFTRPLDNLLYQARVS